MIYLMVVRVPEDAAPTPEEADPTAWVEQVIEAGQSLTGDRVRPPADATCVRVRDGERLVTHGPFAEVVEQISGFDLLLVGSEDEAIRAAAAHPVAGFGALELRALAPGASGRVVEPEVWRDHEFTFVLLVGGADATLDAEQRAAWVRTVGPADRGGSGLTPPEQAVVVRRRDGEVRVERGPFEGRAEQVTGYQLLDVPDLDAALALAAAHPVAAEGVVEVRPRWPLRPEGS